MRVWVVAIGAGVAGLAMGVGLSNLGDGPPADAPIAPDVPAEPIEELHKWPDGVPDRDRSEGVELRAAAWAADYPSWSLENIYCEQYPCIAEFRVPLSTNDDEIASVDASSLGYGPIVVASLPPETFPGGGKAMFKAILSSPDPDDLTHAGWRMQVLLSELLGRPVPIDDAPVR